MGLELIGCENANCIEQVLGRVQWWAFVNLMMNLLILYNYRLLQEALRHWTGYMFQISYCIVRKPSRNILGE